MHPLYSLPLFLTSGCVGTLGVFVYWRKRNERLNQLFGILAYSVAHWSFGYGLVYSAADPQKALHFARFAYLGVVFIPTFFVHFMMQFLGRYQRIILGLCYAASITYALISQSNAFLNGVHLYFWGYYPTAGPVYWTFITFFYSAFAYTIYGLSRAYFKAKRSFEQNSVYIERLRYVFLANCVASFSIMDYLPNYGLNIYPCAYLAAIGWLALMSYGILKHKLMDINIVIRKTLIYSAITAIMAALYAGAVTLAARLMESNAGAPLQLPFETFNQVRGILQSNFTPVLVWNGIFSIIFAVFVILKGPRRRINQLWAITCLAVGLYCVGQGKAVSAANARESFFWLAWFQYLGVNMLPVFFYQFVLTFLNKRAKLLLVMGYGVAFLCEYLSFSGRLYYAVPCPPFKFFDFPRGMIYLLFALYFFFYVGYTLWLLYKAMKSAEGKLKNQIKYVLVGTGIGFAGGATTFFPPYNLHIFPYGIYLIPLYIVTVSYAMYRHQLMDINVVIRKTLLYSFISAALAAVYVGTITVLAQVFEGYHGSSSALSSALAAIFITLLFNPVRIRTQRAINRYFPREHLDPELLQEAAGGFAHEMKRPLTKMSMPAQLALMEIQRAKEGGVAWEDAISKVEKHLQFIVNQSIEAGYMIEAIRELSLSSASPFVPVELRDVVGRAIRLQKDLLDKHRINVDFDLKELPPVLGRAKQLEIVFINLIKNAAEAMSELPPNAARELKIEGDINHRQIVVKISDTGPGIKAEDLGKILSPNFTTKGPHGTGIGLYLSKQIIDNHRGSIEVFNHNSSGAIFVIRFPR